MAQHVNKITLVQNIYMYMFQPYFQDAIKSSSFVYLRDIKEVGPHACVNCSKNSKCSILIIVVQNTVHQPFSRRTHSVFVLVWRDP